MCEFMLFNFTTFCVFWCISAAPHLSPPSFCFGTHTVLFGIFPFYPVCWRFLILTIFPCFISFLQILRNPFILLTFKNWNGICCIERSREIPWCKNTSCCTFHSIDIINIDILTFAFKSLILLHHATAWTFQWSFVGNMAGNWKGLERGGHFSLQTSAAIWMAPVTSTSPTPVSSPLHWAWPQRSRRWDCPRRPRQGTSGSQP